MISMAATSTDADGGHDWTSLKHYTSYTSIDSYRSGRSIILYGVSVYSYSIVRDMEYYYSVFSFSFSFNVQYSMIIDSILHTLVIAFPSRMLAAVSIPNLTQSPGLTLLDPVRGSRPGKCPNRRATSNRHEDLDVDRCAPSLI